MRKVVESAIQNNEKSDFTNSEHIELKKQAARAIKLTYLELKVFKSTEVRTAHLLLSMLKDENSVVTRALFQFNVDYDAVKNEFSMMLSDINHKMKIHLLQKQNSDILVKKMKMMNCLKTNQKILLLLNTKSSTPVLDNFGRDLTKMAADGRLDPIVGREKEIERVSQILSRRKKNNPF